jgi:hypothetical protein
MAPLATSMLKGKKSENSKTGSCDLIHLRPTVVADGASVSTEEDAGMVDGG